MRLFHFLAGMLVSAVAVTRTASSFEPGSDQLQIQKAVETPACHERLANIGRFVTISPPAEPTNCAVADLVRLEHVKMVDQTTVTISPPAILRCEAAEVFAQFIRNDLGPAAAQEFAAPLVGLSGTGSFECRTRNRITPAKPSEHAKGNAIDLRTMSLQNGVLINLPDHRTPKPFREKTRALACSRFTTVLGPGSDTFHNDHIHLDVLERPRGYRICQWDVTDQPVASVEIPLPRPKP